MKQQQDRSALIGLILSLLDPAAAETPFAPGMSREGTNLYLDLLPRQLGPDNSCGGKWKFFFIPGTAQRARV